ncbi:MAG TPA: hypothetical protein VLJ21_05335 [Candidatus Binatia bacterium]|nr:hypothetical protein [Candidatus Binatia bacterium]
MKVVMVFCALLLLAGCANDSDIMDAFFGADSDSRTVIAQCQKEYGLEQAHCLRSHAVGEQGVIDYCDAITVPETYNLDGGEAEAKQIMSVKNDCYLEFAKSQDKPYVCTNLIKDPLASAKCIFSVAQTNNNILACAEINDLTTPRDENNHVMGRKECALQVRDSMIDFGCTQEEGAALRTCAVSSALIAHDPQKCDKYLKSELDIADCHDRIAAYRDASWLP